MLFSIYLLLKHSQITTIGSNSVTNPTLKNNLTHKNTPSPHQQKKKINQSLFYSNFFLYLCEDIT